MLNWKDVVELAQQGNLAPSHRVEKTPQQWRDELTEEQYYVTREHGTERPFSSDMCVQFEPGIYHCVCCQTLLFDSETKFDSHTGWPSFSQPAVKNAISYHIDTQLATPRVEVRCNSCDAHLGHVFPDGPPPSGLRYCVNAVAIEKQSD
ncbi:peptide-methionine (R)-S-oxide reductase MsrB [Vibrio sp. CDRSL-10 TSBA]